MNSTIRQPLIHVEAYPQQTEGKVEIKNTLLTFIALLGGIVLTLWGLKLVFILILSLAFLIAKGKDWMTDSAYMIELDFTKGVQSEIYQELYLR